MAASAPWRSRIVGHGEEAPDQLLANPANFRIHPKPQQDALSGVLDEIGWIQDVIVNQRTGHVIDGHLRVSLAISKREPSIPVVYVDLDEREEKMALATIDPLSAMAATDREQLSALLAEVSTQDAAVQAMLDGLAAEAGSLVQPDVVEDPGAQLDRAEELRQKWSTERGQLWEIGRHRLLCGDSTSTEDVARLMGGERPALLLTDPPYGIGASGMTMGSGQSSKPRQARLSHGQEWDESRPDIGPYLASADRQCIWGGNYFADVLPVTNDWLCWWKKNDDLSFSEFELAWTNYGKQSRHIAHHWSGEIKEHITQKPLPVMAWAMQLCPDDGGVYDPFLGSGTTMVAAEQTGRICYSCEIEPKYVAVALERLAGMGLEPRLAV